MAKTSTERSIERAREATERRAWREGYELLAGLDGETKLEPADLERLGACAFWTGRLDACIDARERAYAGYVAAGERRRAAMMALELTRDFEHRLLNTVASGWLSRAERILTAEPECPEHGYLARWQSLQALSRRDHEKARDLAQLALDIGTRQGDPDVQALGLLQLGAAYVRMGRVEEGMRLFDEAMAAAVAGELNPLDTAVVYCNVITNCRDLTDYVRAGEWTEAAKRWCEGQSIAGFPGTCRVYRAQIMRLRGDLAAARDEVISAINELRTTDLTVAAAGLYELGEIRLRVGDLPGADEAFREAHELGFEPQPGLSLLRLAEGKAAVAASMVNQALKDQSLDRLERARLLPAQVEVNLAADDAAKAQTAASELMEIAESYGTPALRAASECAMGSLLLAQGSAADAAQKMRRAQRLWQEVDAPYEAARCRMLLGAALEMDGYSADALMEYAAARATFERLGAMPDAAKAAAAAQMLEGKQQNSPGRRVSKTFMFTDICGSTSLLEAIGDEAWENLLRWHDQMLRGLFASNRGEEVKHEGDGFFVAFPDSIQAVECAVAIQRALVEHRRAHGFAPQVRIGLHSAEATQREDDYSGKGVHETARIAALAGAGEIVASRQTLLAAGTGVVASEPRSVSVKGISVPLEIATIEWR